MNISFHLTQPQIKAQTKTVTRRLGWHNLKPGQLLNGCEKCQGLKKGEKINVLTQIKITSVHTEPLNAITPYEVLREGFPDMTPPEFVAFFCQSHKGCTPETLVTVINFEYVQPIPHPHFTPKEVAYHKRVEKFLYEQLSLI